jgi:PPP family 3-phenylpropionic acid transporter
LPALGERTARTVLGGLGSATANRPLMALLAITYCMSVSVATMYGFLGIHIEELGGSASLIGFAAALSSTSELPIVAFGGWFIVKFGPVRMIALAIAVYAFRFLAFALITDPTLILPVQLLHGLSYGAFLIASVTLAYRLAGRKQAATAQALLAAMSFGFGSITGSLLGGLLLDSIGTVGLFRGAAALLILTLIAFIVVDRVIGFERTEEPSLSGLEVPA